MTKNWFHKIVYGIVSEHTDHLFTVYKLVDQNGIEIGEFGTSKKPSKGDKIILDNSILKLEPKMFIVNQVYLSQVNYTGILKGKVQKLDHKHVKAR